MDYRDYHENIAKQFLNIEGKLAGLSSRTYTKITARMSAEELNRLIGISFALDELEKPEDKELHASFLSETELNVKEVFVGIIKLYREALAQALKMRPGLIIKGQPVFNRPYVQPIGQLLEPVCNEEIPGLFSPAFTLTEKLAPTWRLTDSILTKTLSERSTELIDLWNKTAEAKAYINKYLSARPVERNYGRSVQKTNRHKLIANLHMARLLEMQRLIDRIPPISLFARMTQAASESSSSRLAVAVHYISNQPTLAMTLLQEMKLYLKCYIRLYLLKKDSLVQDSSEADPFLFDKLIKSPPAAIEETHADELYSNEINTIELIFQRKRVNLE